MPKKGELEIPTAPCVKCQAFLDWLKLREKIMEHNRLIREKRNQNRRPRRDRG